MMQGTREDGFARMLQDEERSGLKLAIKGRTVALVLLALWLVPTRATDPVRALEFLSLIAAFALLGGAHFALIGSRFDHGLLKYAFITIDVTALSVLIATQPLLETVDLPQSINFRNAVFPYYFIILGASAFSFSPGLVAWTGVVGVAGWLGAFWWAVRDMPRTVSWGDIGTHPTTEHFVAVFFDIHWIGTGSRIQEALALLVVALLVAAVMWRARRAVRRKLELDEERRTIADLFGRYVPQTVADALIADRGALEPVERTASILFLDVAGFTTLTEQFGARKVVGVLNAVFDDLTRCIADHDGVITQFQGDAILASFNVPVMHARHADNAVKAALAIQALVTRKAFDGVAISVRVGIATGPVVAGNVGGGGRQNYTVHGDTVNLAARLEAMNKAHGTAILTDAATLDAVIDRVAVGAFRRLGATRVRGLSVDASVYAYTPPGPAPEPDGD